MKLKLKQGDLKAIAAHALKSYPKEGCGVLLGNFKKNAIDVMEVVEAKNVKGSPVEFEADPQLVFEAFKRGEKKGLDLVGIYHSHPNMGAFVSSRDAEIMKLWPGTAWLILGVAKNKVDEQKAYILKNGVIEELDIEVS
ncbi:MAG: M67 family metallopeptidase [Candidatus Hadarchaeota archaeon]